MAHLTSPYFVSTECAVIARSLHGELGRALWSDSVCRGCDQS